MHAAAYAACDLDCAYEAIRATEGELAGVVGRLRSGELAGLNVTIPHKQRVLAYVDAIDPSAGRALAANTLVRTRDGRLVAHNTDVPAIAGELDALRASSPGTPGSWSGTHALVLGTGATARSALVALAFHLRLATITVRGRALKDDASRDAFLRDVHELLARAGATSDVRLEPWVANPETDREVGVVVQASSVGMVGSAPGDVSVDAVAWDVLPESAVVLDVVHRPDETPLVRHARARGLRATDGGGMLARQGALAFELWLGRPAPLDVMRAALAV
jgi:shikimate dehydrogenase